MQLFIRSTENKLYTMNIHNTMTIGTLESRILSEYKINRFSLPYPSDLLVSSVYPEMATINLIPQMVGGGKNMSEYGKSLAMKAIEKKVCRKCYATNSIRATKCRKAACGHSPNLRLKKMKKTS